MANVVALLCVLGQLLRTFASAFVCTAPSDVCHPGCWGSLQFHWFRQDVLELILVGVRMLYLHIELMCALFRCLSVPFSVHCLFAGSMFDLWAPFSSN